MTEREITYLLMCRYELQQGLREIRRQLAAEDEAQVRRAAACLAQHRHRAATRVEPPPLSMHPQAVYRRAERRGLLRRGVRP
jgi:hypothetical protein